MNWSETNFKELPPNATNIVKEQYAQAFILRLMGGILMPDKSQILVRIRWLLHLADFKECTQLSWSLTLANNSSPRPYLARWQSLHSTTNKFTETYQNQFNTNSQLTHLPLHEKRIISNLY
ncbi:hypothetical protein PVK06_004843 [Gossypium arboreum]|uniref:Uncharacterized protein n=1 Tax=Gossypium arboreum TaxID=29729 RepID=A0ABR0QU03_GOSAR|nr:hypothetical protein PVK06_004843 [Gossypium arboreum]